MKKLTLLFLLPLFLLACNNNDDTKTAEERVQEAVIAYMTEGYPNYTPISFEQFKEANVTHQDIQNITEYQSTLFFIEQYKERIEIIHYNMEHGIPCDFGNCGSCETCEDYLKTYTEGLAFDEEWIKNKDSRYTEKNYTIVHKYTHNDAYGDRRAIFYINADFQVIIITGYYE